MSVLVDNISMRRAISLLLLLTFIGCEEDMQSGVSPTYTQKQWNERKKSYYKTKEAKKKYGDEETIEEAREFFDDPIGWAQDLGEPPTAYVESCGSDRPEDTLVSDTESFELGKTLTEEEQKLILEKVGPKPNYSTAVNTPIDRIKFGSDEMKEAGYYQYYPSSNARRQDRRFGTERTVWRVKAAAQILKEKGIIMAVGDISKKGGVGTGGHKSHKKGVDVDLRLIAPDGMGASCAHYSQSCGDSQKTAEMIKAMIAVDPANVRKVFINDPVVQKEVNDYSKSLGLGSVASSCSGHNNHVHISYKN